MAILNLLPNVPTEIALRFPDGKEVEGRFGNQMMYSLDQPANHVMYLDMGPAAKLNILEPRPKEVILACKRSTGKKGDKPQWDFWRPQSGETKPQSGASAESPAPEIASAPVTAPNHNGNHGSTNGNGYSNGNGHMNGRVVNPNLPIPPAKIPMNQAVVEAVRIVQGAMKETGEQWSDQARQDLVSTILIAARQEGWLAIWERGPQ